MKNDVLINLIILGGGGGGLGVCSPRKFFFKFRPLRLFLVASEHSDGESLSVIKGRSSTCMYPTNISYGQILLMA